MNQITLDMILKYKLIALLRGVQQEELLPLCEALYQGGIRLVEVTYAADGTQNPETAAKIRLLADHFADRMAIGAGTVVSSEQVAMTHEAGGSFIISPNTVASVIQKTKELGMISIPGALTPTEVSVAHDLGADFVKLFPIGNLGSGYVKAIKAPLSHIRLLAVGGIDHNNLTEYLRAGVCGVGVGANIVNKDLLRQGNFEAIAALAAEYTARITEYENEG